MKRLYYAVRLMLRWMFISVVHYPKAPLGVLWRFAWRMSVYEMALQNMRRRIRDSI
jgi:hypothetical protein